MASSGTLCGSCVSLFSLSYMFYVHLWWGHSLLLPEHPVNHRSRSSSFHQLLTWLTQAFSPIMAKLFCLSKFLLFTLSSIQCFVTWAMLLVFVLVFSFKVQIANYMEFTPLQSVSVITSFNQLYPQLHPLLIKLWEPGSCRKISINAFSKGKLVDLNYSTALLTQWFCFELM